MTPVMKGFEKDYELYMMKQEIKNKKEDENIEKDLQKKLMMQTIQNSEIRKEAEFLQKVLENGGIEGLQQEKISYYWNRLSLRKYTNYKGKMLNLKTLKVID